MEKTSRQFVFRRVYDMAALVEECIENASSLMELDWTDTEVCNAVVKCHKMSLLHRYIYAMIAVEHRHNSGARGSRRPWSCGYRCVTYSRRSESIAPPVPETLPQAEVIVNDRPIQIDPCQ